MEVRVRVSATRTSKGYSVDATFEMTGPTDDKFAIDESGDIHPIPAPISPSDDRVAEVTEDFCVVHLKRLMRLLEAEFPKEL